METAKLIAYLREMSANQENDIVAHLDEAANKLEAGVVIADWINSGGYSCAPDEVCDAADKIRA